MVISKTAKSMNIKVSGITTMKQLQQLDGLEVDFAGLVFYKSSPHFIGDRISKKELDSSDLDIKKVGIFVNDDYDTIMEAVESYGLDVVQLHGNETANLCEKISAEVETIKSFHIEDNSEKSVDYMVKEYDEVCDYYLFDSASSNGTPGKSAKFDWKKVGDSKIEKPFFLAGGIGATDAAIVRKFMHPDFYGIDINEMFDKDAGSKDMALVLQFMHGMKGK